MTFPKPSFAALLALSISALAGSAAAEYPEKPVSFVVPWPPGDIEDVLTRLIAEEFQETYGVPAAVLNKPGGGGGPFPGAIFVADAPADGYTVGSFPMSIPMQGHEIGIPDLTPAKFEPLGVFATYPFILVAKADAPYKTMPELAEYAKTNEVALGHFGSFLIPSKVSLAYAQTAGFEWGSEAAYDVLDCNTLASGDADVINTTLNLVLPCLDEITPLASVTADRIPLLPDVQTMGELDPAMDIALWNGLFVAKDTPQGVREKIIAVAEKAMTGEKAQAFAEKTGAIIYWQSAEEAAEQILQDKEKLAAINAMIE